MPDDSLGLPVPPAPQSPLRGDFVPANAPIFSGRIIADPKWIARLKARQEAILLLSRGLRAFLSSITPYGTDDICVAIEFLLGNEIAEQLANIANMEAVPIPIPTLEDLERGQRDVEQAQALLDALDKMVDSLPEASRDFLEAAQRPALASNLKRAQEWLSEIQRAMEAAS